MAVRGCADLEVIPDRREGRLQTQSWGVSPTLTDTKLGSVPYSLGLFRFIRYSP
jgi:hypothetical protein